MGSVGAGTSPEEARGAMDGRRRQHLGVEAGAVLAVQAGHDGRQRDDAGDAGGGQVQLLGQVEWWVHLAVGRGGRGHGGSGVQVSVQGCGGHSALPSSWALTLFPAGQGVPGSPGAFPTLLL